MTFSEFIENTNRRSFKSDFPDFFKSFQTDLNQYRINVRSENGTITLEYWKNGLVKKELNFESYLDSMLGKSIEQVNENVIFHYEAKNHFKDNLPLFIIRRHGSYAGEQGSIRRRRGWLVRYNNAWIVYADNFFPRHFFESTYFVNSVSEDEFKNLNLELKMPYSSGGGKFEKKHRVFPSLTHLSSRSNIYLSHLFDLNRGHYTINGKEVSASSILGNGSDNKFGYGQIENWDIGCNILDEKKSRIFRESLKDNELEFLKAYNIRMLSPYNYFPFPKNKYLKPGSENGESHLLRMFVGNYFQRKHEASFNKFIQHGRISGQIITRINNQSV